MATADQIKALVKSIVDNDENRFYTLALQVASKEEKQGHSRVARDIRELVSARDSTVSKLQSVKKSSSIQSFKRSNANSVDIDELLHIVHTNSRISDLVLDDECQKQIDGILTEYRQKHELAKYGLLPKRKMLLTGPPGTGKTLTAKVLATELSLPLYTLQFDGLISRFLGETAAKLRAVFEHIASSKAVYLFDEFDAIGSKRDSQNDVGEIRRVLNSFLQFFEEDSSESLIVCATNHPELLDPALFRRFDDIIEFRPPEKNEAIEFIKSRLFMFKAHELDMDLVIQGIEGLSYADIGQACDEAAKNSVLENRGILTQERLTEAIQRRLR